MVFGAASATGKALEGQGGADTWQDTFQKESSSAASAMTPVGGYVMKKHVFNSQ
jgi:hypothetical protein